MKRQIDKNTTFHQADGKIAIQTHADVSGTLRSMERARNERTGFAKGDGWTLGARIPMPVVEQFANERGISVHEIMNDEKLLAQLLAWAPKFKAIDKSFM